MNLKKSIKKRIATLSDLMHRLLAPAPQRTYNHVLSLGFNCEVAFQFLKFNGFLESCMWNWYGTESTACLSAALSSFDTVGIDFLPKRESRLWKDSNHALYFHGKGNHRIWKPGADPSLLEADKEELISRMTYLKEKFLQLAKSAESVLFVYKVPEEELKRPDYATSCILELRNALADLGFKYFDLMVIVTHDVAPPHPGKTCCSGTAILYHSGKHRIPRSCYHRNRRALRH